MGLSLSAGIRSVSNWRRWVLPDKLSGGTLPLLFRILMLRKM